MKKRKVAMIDRLADLDRDLDDDHGGPDVMPRLTNPATHSATTF
jgi:hypothetical protein